jgi:hypothetical protein
MVPTNQGSLVIDPGQNLGAPVMSEEEYFGDLESQKAEMLSAAIEGCSFRRWSYATMTTYF